MPNFSDWRKANSPKAEETSSSVVLEGLNLLAVLATPNWLPNFIAETKAHVEKQQQALEALESELQLVLASNRAWERRAAVLTAQLKSPTIFECPSWLAMEATPTQQELEALVLATAKIPPIAKANIVLGFDPNAQPSKSDIEAAYRTRVKLYHESGSSPDAVRMSAVNAARDVLSSL